MSVGRQNRPLAVIALLMIIFMGTYWQTQYQLHSGNLMGSFSSNVKTRPSFYDIAFKYNTDKVKLHHYERLYPHLLEPLRDKRLKFLEIGLGCDSSYGPGASYYTWLEYLPNVDLYFIEYDAGCVEKWLNATDQATIYAGDQANPEFLRKVIHESGGEFDVIVDDGGHTMNQQQKSLELLWGAVKPGGLYFIEDLDTSYRGEYGGGIGKSDTFMETLKSMWDDVNQHPGKDDKWPWSKEVERVEFSQEVTAMIKKGVLVDNPPKAELKKAAVLAAKAGTPDDDKQHPVHAAGSW